MVCGSCGAIFHAIVSRVSPLANWLREALGRRTCSQDGPPLCARAVWCGGCCVGIDHSWRCSANAWFGANAVFLRMLLERGLIGGITLTDEAERRSFGTNTPSVCQRLDSFDFSLTRALEPCPLRGRGEAGGTRTGINASDARIPTDMRRYDGQTDHGTLTPQRGAAPPGCAGPGDHCMEPCRMEERRPMVLGQ